MLLTVAQCELVLCLSRQVQLDLTALLMRLPYLSAQRSFEIWSFAIVFFFKLWLAGRKWSYGKAGMTEARVSQRKSKLAAWLREGLIKLGPTFIKIGAPGISLSLV